ncbi:MAG: MBL fold metallo-hydrolase [Candidatus Eisenbacteria bacterium]|nr:MBL fold metallo-hydrolase [Candidatus Eisenbacteria bacterium]
MRILGGMVLAAVVVATAAASPPGTVPPPEPAVAPSTAGVRSAAAPGVASNFEIQQVAPGVYAVLRRDPPGLMCDGNCAFIVNDSDVVVVDAPESSREVLAAIRSVTDKPVTCVVNTHWHDDHVTGNQVYRDAFPGVQFIAHAATKQYLPGKGVAARRQMLQGAPGGVDMLRGLLEKGRSLLGGELNAEERESYTSDIALVEHYLKVVPHTEYILPTRTVEDSLVLRRGARNIEIRRPGPGHTGGDVVVWLPAERVLMSGDLVVWPVPLVGAEQSHVGEWSASLEALRALRPAAIVPGHGPVLRDDSYLALMSGLFASVTRQVRDAVAHGDSLALVRRSIDLSDFREKFAGASRVRGVLFSNYVVGPAVTAAYREATAKP